MSRLFEELPDEISLMCLAHVPYILYPKLELVSRSWKAAIHSVELFKVRLEVDSCEYLLCLCFELPNNTWQLYDTHQDIWITFPKPPTSTLAHVGFSVVSCSHQIFVLGGHARDDTKLVTNEVCSYDLVTRKWSMRAPMLVPRAMFASCCVLDGKIIVAGGFSNNPAPISMVEMYDPEKDLWVPLPDLPRILGECTGVVMGGKMHVMYCGLPIVQIFEPLELKWKQEKYFGQFSNASAVVQDTFYNMIHQYIYKDKLNGRRVEHYFNIAPPEFSDRYGMAMIGCRNKIYLIGGWSWSQPQPCSNRLTFIDFDDVHVLTLEDGEEPTWSSAAPLTRCRGNVGGCTQLRI